MAKPIASVQRAIQILEALTDGPDGAGARDLARQLDIPRSSVQRILQTLELSGAVVQNTETRQYHAGPAILQIGFSFVQDLDVRRIAIPYMERLREASKESVGLTVRMGDTRIYVELLESEFELRAKPMLGRSYPLYSGAPGRVILSYLSDREINRILEDISLVQYTPNTPASPERLWELIRQTRKNGYAIAYEETMLGLSTIAVPILDHQKKAVAAMSISGPVSRFNHDEMECVRDPLLEAAKAISTQLGHRP